MSERYHPSNTLYRGEARDFRHAMELLRAACDYEKVPVEIPDDSRLNESLDQLSKAAARCLSEYAKRVVAAERALYEEWAKSDDENVRQIGEAGLADDWSSLAI